jgi:conjugal transfer pilus assembly protein TraB
MMQGIADAFGKNTNYGVGLSQGGQLSLQQSTDQTTGGAISGAGKGLDKVADFYLQQAVAMFPVIEVNAGRSIDLVLTQGLKAKLPTISGG